MEGDKTIMNLFGGLLQDGEKDFHFGAKTKSYPSPSSTTKHEAETEWMDTYEYLGDNFNPFEDVIIADSIPVIPDEFFKDLKYENPLTQDVFTPQGLSADPFSCIPESQPQYIDLKPEPIYPYIRRPQPQYVDLHPIQSEKPTIQINLKRVKLPLKKTVKSHQLEPLAKSIPKQEPTSHVPNLEKTFSEISNSNLTLQDAISMGCADDILDKLMDIVKPTGDRVLEQISSYIASDSEESYSSNYSPSYSSCSSPGFSSGSSSPSTSYDVIELEDCTVVPRSSLVSPYSIERAIDETSSKKTSKACKRLTGRAKLTIEEKKQKKMDQNKKAATRYRSKKKQEENEASDKLQAEEDRKKELTEKYSNLKQEIRFMKKMMRELYIAKGIVSANAFKN